jgi:hypothetical protein
LEMLGAQAADDEELSALVLVVFFENQAETRNSAKRGRAGEREGERDRE